MTFVMGLLVCGLPVLNLIIVMRFKNRLNDTSFYRKFSSFYEEIKLNDTFSLLSITLFSFRRLSLSLMVVFFSDYSTLAIQLYMIFSLLNLIYLL